MLERQELTSYLEDLDNPIGKALNLGIALLVLLSSAIFVLETYPLAPDLRSLLDGLDSILLGIFVIEYLLRLWCAEKKGQYLFSLYSAIDLIAILPFFLGAANISFIRVFRWFRILRLIRFIEGKTLIGYVSTEDSSILIRIAFTLFSIIFVYSGLIYQTEHLQNPQQFSTFLDAVYFSIATMTTVGFGDIAPISQAGRLLTVLMILTGIALIPWQVGDLIKRLVKTANQIDLPCGSCGLGLHDADARFCKNCGFKLRS
ncbi:MAG: ion transporter [Leptolyngbyaceae cyanobacterium bins.59]|nr:ion transporter [Leptolyngbyaceae cyanobacterium bins.59]